MERPGGFYPGSNGHGSGSVAPPLQHRAGGGYQNEQSAPAPHLYFPPPPQDMQQCYQPPPSGYHMPFPNDPYFAWNQQNAAWLAQMQQSQQQQQHAAQHGQHPGGYLPPPPPPPPASMLLGRQTLNPPPPPPNLDAILEGLNEEAEQKEKEYVRRLTTSEKTVKREEPAAPTASSLQLQQQQLVKLEPAATPAASAAATPSLSSTSTIPSLLEGLRADVAARNDRDMRNERSAPHPPDLKAIEHAASILSSRTAKSPAKSRREEERRSRRAEERSDSRKENRGEEPRRRDSKTRREERRRGEGGERERDRLKSSQSTTSSSTRSSHKSTTSASSSRRDRDATRSNQRSDDSHREPRRTRNGERRERKREKEEWVEKPSKDTTVEEEEHELQPQDIQLNVREGARAEAGVQVYLHSEEETEEDEDEDEEEEEEGRGVADSDMDIETEADAASEIDAGSSIFQQLNDSHHSGDWGSCAPEDEDEYCLTPKMFDASGPSRRVNSTLYRESHKRARALASQALSEEYRERYDLISKHLRSRCIFRGLESSRGPDAPRLTINDPRPTSKHVQTFPSKESNVQYHGPDSFVAPGYKKTAAGGSSTYSSAAPPGTFTYFSRTKLVRAPVAPSASGPAAVSNGPFSLKRTIQNGAVAGAAPAATFSSSLSSTQSSSSTTTTTTAAAAAVAAEGPTPAKLSKVDEMMANLLSAPSSPRTSIADADAGATMRKTVSEARLDVVVARSEEASRPSASAPLFAQAVAAAHSPRADRATLAAHASAAASPQLPPRSALSFRKIGDHVVRPGSKLCFEWAESGECKAGVFCHYEHGEGAERMEKKVCSRMLRGLCRGALNNCPLPHGLLPHQMPICEHYLRMQCNHGPEECGLVHIKHNEKVPVCVFFNQGKCTKEDDCTFRHQYRSDVVRSLGVHAPPHATHASTRPLEQRGLRTSSSRLPKGRALLTAARAAPSMTSSATSSPGRATPAAAAAEEPDTSTFAWIE